jgi:hypothetical protein
MPIVTSRASEIRKLLTYLEDPKRRAGAVLRLRSFGSRVVPHVGDELGRLDADTRSALLDALGEVQTAEGKALRKRIARVEMTSAATAARPNVPRVEKAAEGAEASALDAFRTLPPPRSNEEASLSRERGEAHLVLARQGSRLARKDLLLSLDLLGARRARLYCEAAGLIGDAEFLVPLARLAPERPEAGEAIARIAAREKITLRSKVMRSLDEPLRLVVARSIAEH